MSENRWEHKRPSAAEKKRAAVYASPEHRRLRREWVARVAAAGGWPCWRCGRTLLPGSRWHLGHDDDDRSVYRGPECVSCNLRAAASKGARTTNARRQGLVPPPASAPAGPCTFLATFRLCRAACAPQLRPDGTLPLPPGCQRVTAQAM